MKDLKSEHQRASVPSLQNGAHAAGDQLNSSTEISLERIMEEFGLDIPILEPGTDIYEWIMSILAIIKN